MNVDNRTVIALKIESAVNYVEGILVEIDEYIDKKKLDKEEVYKFSAECFKSLVDEDFARYLK